MMLGPHITAFSPVTFSMRATRVRQSARVRSSGSRRMYAATLALVGRVLGAVADDRVPVAVRLFLSVRRDLEGKGLAVLERRTAIDTEAGDAQNGELHRQFIARLAARIVTRRLLDGGY